MIEETIKNIEATINQSSNLSDEKRTELIKLIGELKAEIDQLAESNKEGSENIARYAQSSTDESLSQSPNQESKGAALNGLKKSIEGFETSHPKLTQIINEICTTLSHIGI